MNKKTYFKFNIFILFLYNIVKFFYVFKYPKSVLGYLILDTIINFILITYANMDISFKEY